MKTYLKYKDTLVAPGTVLHELMTAKQTPAVAALVEQQWAATDLAYRKLHGLPWDFRGIASAPQVHGAVLWLRGTYASDPGGTVVEVRGFFESAADGAYTEGWCAESGSVFYPTHWAPYV